MKIKESSFHILLIAIALVAITLRLTHVISSTSFGFIGLIFAIFGFVRSAPHTTTSEEQSIEGIKEIRHSHKKRYNYLVEFIKLIGLCYLAILLLDIFGQL